MAGLRLAGEGYKPEVGAGKDGKGKARFTSTSAEPLSE